MASLAATVPCAILQRSAVALALLPLRAPQKGITSLGLDHRHKVTSDAAGTTSCSPGIHMLPASATPASAREMGDAQPTHGLRERLATADGAGLQHPCEDRARRRSERLCMQGRPATPWCRGKVLAASLQADTKFRKQKHGHRGLVAMTSAQHAEGRQFDPGRVYAGS